MAVSYGRLGLQGDHWVMQAIPPHVSIKLKNVFPRIYKAQSKIFRFRNTPEICADLRWFLFRYPMEMSESDRRALETGHAAFDTRRNEIESILTPDWKPPAHYGFRPGCEMYTGQRQDVEIIHRTGRALLMHGTGMGKTWSALGAMMNPKLLPAAVIAPAHLPNQWQEEYVNPLTYMNAHIIDSTKAYNLPPANIYLFKYSNIIGWVDIAATGMFRSVIFDEVHELRNGTGTKKGAAAKVFADHANYRVGMSATPVWNYGDEIFRIIEFIDPGALGSWEEFVREWCTFNGRKWLVNDPDALGQYLRDEQQLAFRRVRQGRPVNTIVIEVDADAKIQKAAEDLARDLAIKVVRGGFFESGQAARELDALTRLVTGVSKAKSVAAYVRMLVKAGQPVILFGWHKEVYKIWAKELSDLKPVFYTGNETQKKKNENKKTFIGGKTDLCIMSLRSGVGLDGFQKRCWTVVFGELDWTKQVHEQNIGRVDRPGQIKDEVMAVFCITNSGSDPTVMSVQGIKGSQARGITDPGAGVLKIHTDEGRIKLLAQDYLARAGIHE